MRLVAGVLGVLLLLPGGAAAQEDEPLRVCTEVPVPKGGPLDVPEDSPFADIPAFRGMPSDGEACDIVIYLPLALVDGAMLGSLVGEVEQWAEAKAAEEAEARREARRSKYGDPAGLTCESLRAMLVADAPVDSDDPYLLELERCVEQEAEEAEKARIEALIAEVGDPSLQSCEALRGYYLLLPEPEDDSFVLFPEPEDDPFVMEYLDRCEGD